MKMGQWAIDRIRRDNNRFVRLMLWAMAILSCSHAFTLLPATRSATRLAPYCLSRQLRPSYKHHGANARRNHKLHVLSERNQYPAPKDISANNCDKNEDDDGGEVPSWHHDGNEDDDKDDFVIEATPKSQKLIARITESYVFGKEENEISVDDILSVVESDFRIRKVPVQIGDIIFDASSTGIDIDQSISEILSFAAYHGLPKRLTAELLDDSLGDPFVTAKKVFQKEGWKAVSFPKGLAIQPQKSTRRRPRFSWRSSSRRRIEEAIRAVKAAAAARSPIRQFEAPKDFLSKLTAEEYTTSFSLFQKEMPFFPNNLPVPRLSWRKLRQVVEKNSSKIKSQGKAGFLAYAVFNFFVYSVGMLWQWRRIAAADVTAASSAVQLTARKFGRVFGTVYLISNLLKIPKLLSVAGLVPLTDRILKTSHERSGWSETRLVVAFSAVLAVTWVALLAVPLLSEFSRLRKLVLLERLYDQCVTIPAAHFTVV